MEILLKIIELLRIRWFIIICLIALFIWCGNNAIQIYWSQPLTTDLSYTFGDTDEGIQFPMIMICPYNFVSNNDVLKHCSNESWNFYVSFLSCMRTDKTFNVDAFMTSIQLDMSTVIETIILWNGTDYIDLQNFDGLHLLFNIHIVTYIANWDS